MATSVKDVHKLELGSDRYHFRTPRVHDGAKLRRILTRQRVRNPGPHELHVASLEGVKQMAELASDAEEGQRQIELLEEWQEITKPIVEDDLEEPDCVKRAELHKQMVADQQQKVAELYPEIAAIWANLERHYPPYAELIADRNYWSDISRIEAVRLLLVAIGDGQLPRDEDGFLTEAAYELLPSAHRASLAEFALRLMAPTEAQRKN